MNKDKPANYIRLCSSMFKNYPDVVDINAMCQMLGGISTKTGYKLLSKNKIRSIKIGHMYKIPKIFILEYLLSENTHGKEVVGGSGYEK